VPSSFYFFFIYTRAVHEPDAGGVTPVERVGPAEGQALNDVKLAELRMQSDEANGCLCGATADAA
jgi:hypothetical protein